MQQPHTDNILFGRGHLWGGHDYSRRQCLRLAVALKPKSGQHCCWPLFGCMELRVRITETCWLVRPKMHNDWCGQRKYPPSHYVNCKSLEVVLSFVFVLSASFPPFFIDCFTNIAYVFACKCTTIFACMQIVGENGWAFFALFWGKTHNCDIF